MTEIPQRAEEMLGRTPDALILGGILVGAALIGLAIHAVVFWAARRLAKRTAAPWDDKLILSLRPPARLLFPLFGMQFTLPKLALDEGALGLLSHAIALGLIVGITWAVIRVIRVGAEIVVGRHDMSATDNLAARRVATQVRVLSRTCGTIAGIVGLASALMTFPSVREVGASLLASAGIAGLAIGIAARPLLTNMIAGLQIAFTEPIRLDDVVIVEGEWGRVEELSATYVVVRIWDERRLVVPLSYFLEKPFENWTRSSAQILGTVFLYVDYQTPVARIREELEAAVKDDPDWDGRVQVVQVTDATAQTMQVRALVSAADAGKAFSLRCRVRERLIDFLQREYPESLPRARVEWRGQSEPFELRTVESPAGAHNGVADDSPSEATTESTSR